MPLFRCGPSGGVGGDDFDDEDAAPALGVLNNSVVNNIRIRHGKFIDSIRITLQDKSSGQIFQLPQHGGPGGASDDTVPLRRNEIIFSIEGRFGRFVDSLTINVMNISTGKVTQHGPFGGSGGEVPYLYQAPALPQNNPPVPADNGITGFFGRAGRFVDQIGVITLRPR